MCQILNMGVSGCIVELKSKIKKDAYVTGWVIELLSQWVSNWVNDGFSEHLSEGLIEGQKAS